MPQISPHIEFERFLSARKRQLLFLDVASRLPVMTFVVSVVAVCMVAVISGMLVAQAFSYKLAGFEDSKMISETGIPLLASLIPIGLGGILYSVAAIKLNQKGFRNGWIYLLAYFPLIGLIFLLREWTNSNFFAVGFVLMLIFSFATLIMCACFALLQTIRKDGNLLNTIATVRTAGVKRYRNSLRLWARQLGISAVSVFLTIFVFSFTAASVLFWIITSVFQYDLNFDWKYFGLLYVVQSTILLGCSGILNYVDQKKTNEWSPHVNGVAIFSTLACIILTALISKKELGDSSYPTQNDFDLFFWMGMTAVLWSFAMRRLRRAAMGTRRTLQFRARDYAENANAQFALVLRSFASDDVYVPAIQSSNYSDTLQPKVNRSFVGIIIDAAYQHLPAIGAMNVFDGGNAVGIAPEILPIDDWEEFISEKMTSSSIIVFITGDTEAIEWEAEELKRRDLLKKTIIVIPPPDIFKKEHSRTGGQRALNALGFRSVSDDTRLLFWDASRSSWRSLRFSELDTFRYSEGTRLAVSHLLKAGELRPI